MLRCSQIFQEDVIYIYIVLQNTNLMELVLKYLSHSLRLPFLYDACISTSIYIFFVNKSVRNQNVLLVFVCGGVEAESL